MEQDTSLPLSLQNSTKSRSRKPTHKLPYSNILSELFVINDNQSNDQDDKVYFNPIVKSKVLEKHQMFSNKVAKIFDDAAQLPSCFTKMNLKTQMQYRMVPLVADPFSDQVR